LKQEGDFAALKRSETPFALEDLNCHCIIYLF